MTDESLLKQVDALLPQTQCGLCGHGGCLPYAKAMVEEQEAHNRCPPGGDLVIAKLAELLKRPTISLLQPAKPTQIVMIEEDKCIGCMKCITACPVDAIVGAAKLMHTVLSDACTGCELCIPPCPVDCIIITPRPAVKSETEFYERAHQAKQRFEKHQLRLEQTLQNSKQQQTQLLEQTTVDQAQDVRKDFIAQALARAKLKKEQRR